MNHLFKSESGSVSIFLIIIITVVFFFNAVLIDYARIITASYQTERAIKAAVRSALSAYDTELYNSYGLFGASGNESEIYNETLKYNLSNPFGGFNYIKFNLDENESELKTNFELANHSVFKQQILEDMKYKAPIDFTIDIIEQFSSLSVAMKEASNTASILNDISKYYEIRNDSLNKAISYRKSSADIVNKNTRNQLDEIITNYNNYQNNIAELSSLIGVIDDKDEKEVVKKRVELEKSIEGSKQNAINLSVQIYNYYFQNSTIYNNYLKSAEEELNIAINSNEKMKDIIKMANSEVNNEDYEIVSKNMIDAEGETIKAINNIKTINENISKNQELPLAPEFFASFRKDIIEQKKLYQEILIKLELLYKKVPSVFNNNGSIKDLEIINNGTKELLDNYNIYFGDYTNTNNKISKVKNELFNTLQDVESKKVALENQGRESLDKLLELFDSISMIENQNDDLDFLNQKLDKYIDFNAYLKKDTTNNLFSVSPSETIGEATNEMDNIFYELSKLILDIRDDIYLEEYAFARFNHYNPSNYNNLFYKDTENIYFDDDKLVDLLNVSNQEVEYIIYGLNSVGGNFAAAIKDIFSIRLAINLIEAFSNPIVLSATNPVLIFLEAILYSISASTSDLINILQGEKVPLAKNINMINYDYKNYLRILYFIRGIEAEKISRIQAVIDFNSGKDLTLIPTKVVGEATISLDLWFLPGVMNAFNYVGILEGKVDKNSYFINKNAAYAY